MQKFELWVLKSGSVRPGIFPNLECLPHWRNSGSLSWSDLDILANRLKGGMLGLGREGSGRFPGSSSLLPQIYLQ